MGKKWVAISHHTSALWQSIVFSRLGFFCLLLFCFVLGFFFFTESMGKDIVRGLLEDRVLNQEKMKIEEDGNDTEINLV